MPQCCAVPFCSERKGGHKFPKDEIVLKQWLVAIRRDDYVPSIHSRVCKKHFSPDDYELPKESNTENPTPKLRPKVVPSLFSWNNESKEKIELKRKCAERDRRRKKLKSAALPSNTEEKESEEQFTFDETYLEVHIEDFSRDVSVQCSLCKCNERSTNTANSSDSVCNRKSTLNMFQIENLTEKPDVVQFYTGLDSYNNFMFVFNLFGDEVNDLKYYPSLQSVCGKHALSPSDQFYLTLIKLRRNMCDKELSLLFEISITTVRSYFTTWVNYLYCKFKDLNVRTPKKIKVENVTCQEESNTDAVIMDCKEAKIEKPLEPVSQEATSTSKSAKTLKVLVGISGSGSVNFVSDAYAGSVSDRELFEKCGKISELQKGDVILGDGGCNVQDLVSHMADNAPQSISEGSDQLKSDKLTSEQTNVKRVIGLGKTFKILSSKLSSDLAPLGGKIIFLCFMLASFRKNPT